MRSLMFGSPLGKLSQHSAPLLFGMMLAVQKTGTAPSSLLAMSLACSSRPGACNTVNLDMPLAAGQPQHT